MDISDFRKDYTVSGLTRDNLKSCPMVQFENWFNQALAAKINEPNAMSLATVSKEGKPSIRTVLLKSFDQSGFVFYSNYQSNKAKDIDGNPQVALLFPWVDLERQVRVSGSIKKMSKQDSKSYFQSRPLGSQIGAWSSPQSEVISNRSELEDRLQLAKNKFAGKNKIPLPDFWGGYRVVPEKIEFWQGRTNRLHDRFLFTKSTSNNSSWKVERLAP